MATTKRPIVLFIFILLYVGWLWVAGDANAQTVEKDVTCDGEYIRGITKEHIHAWQKTQQYMPEHFRKYMLVTYKRHGVEEKIYYKSEANAIVVGQHVLTVSHILDDPEIRSLADWFNRKFYGQAGITDVEFHLDAISFELVFSDFQIEGEDAFRLIVLDKRSHLALFRIEKPLPDPYSFAALWGDINKFSGGEDVIMAGNPLGFGPHMRFGYVSTPFISESETSSDLVPPEMLRGSYFAVQIPIIPGDYGSPLFAITPCGESEIIGMAFISSPGGVWGDIRWIIRVDVLKDFLRENGVNPDASRDKFATWLKEQAEKEAKKAVNK